MNLIIKIKKLKEDAKLQNYHHPGDVGMDLYSMETKTLNPGEHYIFYHGFGLEFDEGYAAIIKDKSGISKIELHTMGGVYDAGFRGEYNTHLVNFSDKPYTIEKGDKVAQLIIYPVVIATLEEVDELSDSARGAGAFGSTGKK